jgi:hypothetical protein
MAIMQHPTNNWFPSTWFTRDYGFFSPTPMYFPADDKNTYLKKGDIVHLKYRVLIHNGTQETAKIAEAFATCSREIVKLANSNQLNIFKFHLRNQTRTFL